MKLNQIIVNSGEVCNNGERHSDPAEAEISWGYNALHKGEAEKR